MSQGTALQILLVKVRLKMLFRLDSNEYTVFLRYLFNIRYLL